MARSDATSADDLDTDGGFPGTQPSQLRSDLHTVRAGGSPSESEEASGVHAPLDTRDAAGDGEEAAHNGGAASHDDGDALSDGWEAAGNDGEGEADGWEDDYEDPDGDFICNGPPLPRQPATQTIRPGNGNLPTQSEPALPTQRVVPRVNRRRSAREEQKQMNIADTYNAAVDAGLGRAATSSWT